ncbi:MAG: hypothetical protein SGARI_001052, partial [Bacillariaceae sp.]
MSISSQSGPNVVSVASSQMDFAPGSHATPNDAAAARFPPIVSTLPTTMTSKHIEVVKLNLIDDLRKSGGMIDTTEAQQAIDILQTYYSRGGCKKIDPTTLVGNWLTISKPKYSELKGTTVDGQSIYTLGRISFDMFKPTNLKCSIMVSRYRGNVLSASFNQVKKIDPKNHVRKIFVPKKLMRDIRKGQALHTYDIS